MNEEIKTKRRAKKAVQPELIKESEPEPEKMTIEHMLDQSTLNLLQVMPQNPQAVGLVLAQTGRTLPPELKTFDEVKNWLEAQGPTKEAKEAMGLKIQLLLTTITGNPRARGHVMMPPDMLHRLAKSADSIVSFMDWIRYTVKSDLLAKIKWDRAVDTTFLEIMFQDSNVTRSAALKKIQSIDPELYNKLTR